MRRFRKDFNEYEKRHLAIVEGERRNERIQKTREHGERTVMDSLEEVLIVSLNHSLQKAS